MRDAGRPRRHDQFSAVDERHGWRKRYGKDAKRDDDHRKSGLGISRSPHMRGTDSHNSNPCPAVFVPAPNVVLC